ncbi:hypothetical protein [Rickettsiales endosymbiont of Peranema trichophorum]|uniref:hypothetical protein n=1 Tax=Rickettsiales endosymbiont of Peranema trichophorum TaxID=2486577 RepID=UPI0013EEC563|nr:hypothetical protein [Rickettsiales endosymbiont of Peranema trichophorum]
MQYRRNIWIAMGNFGVCTNVYNPIQHVFDICPKQTVLPEQQLHRMSESPRAPKE